MIIYRGQASTILLGSALRGTASALAVAFSLFANATTAAQAAVTNGGDSTTLHSSGIETVVVTAEKRPENVQNIPSTMSALSAEDLRARGISSVGDLAHFVPSVNFGTFGYGTQISARGVGMNLIAGEGESSVLVQLDGVPLSRPSMLELLQSDLGRVEFLMGPQGTLYGRNATGGVLNLVTPAPPESFDAGLTLGMGNFGQFSAKGHIGGPLMDGVDARLFLGTDDHAGYIDNLTTGRHIEASRNNAARLALNATISPDLTIEARLFYLKTNNTGPVYKPIDPINGLPPGTFDLAPWKIRADSPYAMTLEMMGGSVQANLKLSDEDELTSLTAYVRYNDNVGFDSDGTSLDLFNNYRNQVTGQFTQEFDYLHDTGRTQLVLGAFYELEPISDLGDKVLTPGFTPFNGLTSLGFGNKKLNYNASIFGDITYHISPELKVFGGLRGILDHQAMTVTNSLNFGAVEIDTCTPADPLGNEHATNHELTGRAGAQYDLSDSSNVFGSYSHGYTLRYEANARIRGSIRSGPSDRNNALVQDQ